VKSAGQAEKMLLCSASCSRRKCNKTAHVLTQQVYHGVTTSMLHHDRSMGCSGRGSSLLQLPFPPGLALQSCKWTPTIANVLTTTN